VRPGASRRGARDGDAARSTALLSPQRARVSAVAHARNQALQEAGYRGYRVPACELDGIADKAARKAFLAGSHITFTRSDTSMVFEYLTFYLARPRVWWALVGTEYLTDKSGDIRGFASPKAALAAARKAEKA
jgi:hypothetical protein